MYEGGRESEMLLAPTIISNSISYGCAFEPSLRIQMRTSLPIRVFSYTLYLLRFVPLINVHTVANRALWFMKSMKIWRMTCRIRFLIYTPAIVRQTADGNWRWKTHSVVLRNGYSIMGIELFHGSFASPRFHRYFRLFLC